MNRKGFTLIELLAIITILAIIFLIIVPLTLNIIITSKEKTRENSIKLYAKAIENGVSNYFSVHQEKEEVTLQELEDGGFVKYSGAKVECEKNQISKMNVYLEDCTVNGTKVEYKYGNYDPVPELNNGLIPVIYKNNKWIVVDKTDSEWYDYDNQKWANAVTLLPGITKEVGDEVKVDGTEASTMLVWIPRYEYKIEGTYGKGGTSTTNPGEIEVNFVPKETITPTEGYHINDAFTFDGEKSGFWVGKFELSHTIKSQGTGDADSDYIAANLNCTTDTCSEAQYLRILPNKSSLRYNSISNFWYGIKSIENASSFGLTNIDIHMMKNSEWGAVAYLSQSKYGKYGNKDYEGVNKEVYQNKSSDFITGSSNGTPSQETSYTQCTYDQAKGIDINQDQNNCGPGASTTGNIYGVYDMSGGSYEYVMGVYGDSNGIYSGYDSSYNSGFNGRTGQDNGEITNGATVPVSKYYDKYTTNNPETACNNEVCFGHGLSETAGWYGDFRNMLSEKPWFLRSGYYGNDTSSGFFLFDDFYGDSYNKGSTRVVGFGK